MQRSRRPLHAGLKNSPATFLAYCSLVKSCRGLAPLWAGESFVLIV
ncbi:hypothetical protein FHS21_003762, partial [Phyllobacterium trifolii]|nr:hypothetical protein [Phyllobacterium trifolii]